MGTMSASDAAPLPRLGEVFFDVRGDSRSMRLSWYADTGVAVFSIWQGGTCTGTFRLPIADLPRMVRALERGPHGAVEAGQEELPVPGAAPAVGPEAHPAIRDGDFETGQQTAARPPGAADPATGSGGGRHGQRPPDVSAAGLPPPGTPVLPVPPAAPNADEPTGVYRRDSAWPPAGYGQEPAAGYPVGAGPGYGDDRSGRHGAPPGYRTEPAAYSGGGEHPGYGGDPAVDYEPGGFGGESPAGYGEEPPAGYGEGRRAGFREAPTAGYGEESPAGFWEGRRAGFREEPTAGYGEEPPAGFPEERRAGFRDAPTAGYGTDPPAGFREEPAAGYRADHPAGIREEPTAGYGERISGDYPEQRPGYGGRRGGRRGASPSPGYSEEPDAGDPTEQSHDYGPGRSGRHGAAAPPGYGGYQAEPVAGYPAEPPAGYDPDAVTSDYPAGTRRGGLAPASPAPAGFDGIEDRRAFEDGLPPESYDESPVRPYVTQPHVTQPHRQAGEFAPEPAASGRRRPRGRPQGEPAPESFPYGEPPENAYGAPREKRPPRQRTRNPDGH
jgi:hypothetical protein